MKKLTIASVSALLGFSAIALAAQTYLPYRLTWDDPNPPGTVVGYKVWEQGVSTNIATVTTNSWVVSLSPGVHTVWVTPTSVDGFDGPPSAPKTLASLIAVVNLHVTQP